MFERVTAGILAGAVGTVAIDVVSTLDMAVRGRASIPLPADVAQRLARVGLSLGEGEQAGPPTSCRTSPTAPAP
jgi:hypothetical protein